MVRTGKKYNVLKPVPNYLENFLSMAQLARLLVPESRSTEAARG
jgi:hypothetical protein